jgi:hypothetical protein
MAPLDTIRAASNLYMSRLQETESPEHSNLGQYQMLVRQLLYIRFVSLCLVELAARIYIAVEGEWCMYYSCLEITPLILTRFRYKLVTK